MTKKDWIYRNLLRPILFKQDPEEAHEFAMEALSKLSAVRLFAARRAFTGSSLASEVAGIAFPNPVGLAAGCDKNGRAIPLWPHCGFGFVEVGTVTAQPQSGNPKPRVFRYPRHDALINRLGFNSEGSQAVAMRMATLRETHRSIPTPIAINIGKTKVVEGEDAVLEDYRTSFKRLSPFADFVIVNVSSPNTPGLRLWQERGPLTSLLSALMEEATRGKRKVPLFVKISPDMNETDMVNVCEAALELRLAGIVATNTTLAREGAYSGLSETGGLSGKPLTARADEVMRFLYRQTGGALPLIGVGGIGSAEDAFRRIKCGASLVQIYTSFVYEGPFFPRNLNQELMRLMERDGVRNIRDAIGTEAK